MDVTATLDAPCPPEELFPWVDDRGGQVEPRRKRPSDWVDGKP